MTLREQNTLPSLRILDLHGQGRSWSAGPSSQWLLLVLMKTSCGACKTALPFIERIWQRFSDSITVWSGSQSTAERTSAFVERYGCTFPFFLDQDFRVSKLVDPVGVPAVLLFGSDGKCLEYHEGFGRDSLEHLSARLAVARRERAAPLFTEEDTAPPFRPACESSHRLDFGGDEEP